MFDQEFHAFAKDNIIELDALSRRYAAYRIGVSRMYLDELEHKITSAISKLNCNRAITDRYELLKGTLRSDDKEQWWGWWREANLFGRAPVSVHIAFGLHCASSAFAGEWLFGGGRCWTGINVWVGEFQEQFRQIALNFGVRTRERDENWLCWWPCEFLTDARVDELQERLTGPERGSGQDAIIEQLLKWTEIFERIEANARMVS
jgi:hypothetical protein